MRITKNANGKGLHYAMTEAGHGSIKSTQHYVHKNADQYHAEGYTDSTFKKNGESSKNIIQNYKFSK